MLGSQVFVFVVQHSSTVFPLALGMSVNPCLWQKWSTTALHLRLGGVNPHVDPSPPHMPHLSTVLPELGIPSHPLHDDPSPLGTPQTSWHALLPPQTLQSSTVVPELGIPSHPLQASSPLGTPHASWHAFVPPHMPQSSMVVPELGIPSHPLQELSPPHMPHSSMVVPELGIPSHPAHVELSPPHMPHASTVVPELSMPSHPLHVESSPPQTPQLSTAVPEWGIPSHPAQVELFPKGTPHESMQDVPSPPQTLHMSRVVPELGIPSHPAHEDPSPPQTSHASKVLPELGIPSHPLQVELSPLGMPQASWHALFPAQTPQSSNTLHTHVPCPSGEPYPSGHISQLLLDEWLNPSVTTPSPSGHDWLTHGALCVVSRLYCGYVHGAHDPSHPYPGGHSSHASPCHGVLHVHV
tara:strand:- start:522 stop:1751 length:1230 start_codon:yes stop_codon:yes gene_type:complete